MARRLAQAGLLFLFLFVSLAADGQPKKWTEALLVERLNQAAEKFHTLTAAVSYTKVTVVVNDQSTEAGRLYFNRNRKLLIEFLNPEPKEILFDGDKLLIYYPKLSQVQEFDLEKHRALVDQFLRLGFGSKGDDLRDAFLITVLGEVTLDGRAVLQVELTPRDERIRNQIHKLHLWFDMASWVPIQQKFFEVGGDYLVTKYTEIKVNVPIPDSKLRLSAPRNVKRIKPRASM